MLSAFSKTSAWINTMSTSDPGTSEPGTTNRRSAGPSGLADQAAGAPTDDSGSAAMFALPDPAVIARLANEFFAALPGSVTTPENVGASTPARATVRTLPAVPSVTPSSPAG